MKNKVISSLFVLMFILTNLVKSWAETGDKPTLMIGSVIASEAVKSLAATDNKTRDLDQLIQSLDSEFQNQIIGSKRCLYQEVAYWADDMNEKNNIGLVKHKKMKKFNFSNDLSLLNAK